MDKTSLEALVGQVADDTHVVIGSECQEFADFADRGRVVDVEDQQTTIAIVALCDISAAADDIQPLIARNHARKLVEEIKKGKFKSPVKK